MPARQPLDTLGVQGHGFLLVVSQAWVVRHASANAGRWLGRDAEELPGLALRGLLADGAVHAVRNALQSLGGSEAVERVFGVDLTGDGSLYDAAVHLSRGDIVIECEPLADAPQDMDFWRVQAVLSRLHACGTVEALLRDGARLLQSITGYDRVLICRFGSDGSGEAVAEALRGGQESHLGRHYPAASALDPAQVLHRRDWVRSLGDIAAAPVPLVPGRGTDGNEPDLSMCMLRSLRPEDLDCLHDEAVAARLSVAVNCQGALWGLLSCQHYRPRQLSFRRRAALEAFGQTFSLLLESLLRGAPQGAAAGSGEPAASGGDASIAAPATATTTATDRADPGLSHRIRALLSLIRALVRQSAAQAEGLESFAALLDDRIQSLARTHEMIGSDGRSPAPLRGLIAAEAAARLRAPSGRVTMEGPPVLLQPEAFSTLALVIHELAANSARYGALRGEAGRVEVAWRGGRGEPLVVEWRESGGPPVLPPRRRGFGSLIVERAIPYQLRGGADLRFDPGGVQARLTLPARYVQLQPEDG